MMKTKTKLKIKNISKTATKTKTKKISQNENHTGFHMVKDDKMTNKYCQIFTMMHPSPNSRK